MAEYGALVDKQVLISSETTTHRTPTNSCCQSPGSSRSTTRKVARSCSKQKEETELFDSLLESFVQKLQDYSNCDEEGVKSLLPSPVVHTTHGRSYYEFNTAASPETNMHCHGKTNLLQNVAIKLEDLLSDSESTEREHDQHPHTHCTRQTLNTKSPHSGRIYRREERHLLQSAGQHYNQTLQWKGMKGLVYNVIGQRQLKLRAERNVDKQILKKYFIKV